MYFKRNINYSESRFAKLLLMPVFLYLMAALFFPLGWGIIMSFTDKTIGSPPVFNGIENYRFLLGNQAFLISVKNTLLYTFFCIFFKTIFGVLLALLLNLKFHGRNIVRALLLIPWTLPNMVSLLNWKWIFANQGGALNGLLSALGLIDKNILWLAQAETAFMLLIIVNVWRGVPFFGITILSKLQTIPDDLYHASSIDGANVFQKFFHITLPSIKDITALSALVSTIWTINAFEDIWLLTGGGPNNKTSVITVFSYTTGMQNLQIGRAVAVSVLAMPLLIFLISIVTKFSTRDQTE